MGLRDLLGIGKRSEANKAAEVSSSVTTLRDDLAVTAGEGAKTLDTEPLTTEFSTPAGMVGDLKGLGGARGGGAMPNQPYNPYVGLGGPFDPNMSKALYRISDAPEFLFDEERNMKRRSWSENLTFLTGAGYLGGVVAGGGIGAYQGLRSTPEPGLVDTQKLRLNRVLNASGARGASLGNAWGCLGLYYAAIESFAGHYAGQEYPALIAVLSGAGAGSLYKSMSGPRAMAVYGVVGAGLSAANQVGQAVVGSATGRR